MHASQVVQQSAVHIHSSSYDPKSKTTTLHFSTFGQISNLAGRPIIEVSKTPLYVIDVVDVITQLKKNFPTQKSYYKLHYKLTASESINTALTKLNKAIQAHNLKLDENLATELDKLGFTDATASEQPQVKNMTQALQGQPGWVVD